MLFRNYLKLEIISLLGYTIILQLGSYRWGYSLGKRSKYSKFFDQASFDSVESIKEQRSELEALEYLREKHPGFQSASSEFQIGNTSKVDNSLLCITIVTKSRPAKTNYVIRSLAYLLSRLEPLQKSEMKSPIKVYLTNTDTPEWINSTLSTLSPIVEIVHTREIEKELGVKGVNYRKNNRSMYRNETLGKALTFYYASTIGCSHLALLEDDGIVSRDFYWKIQEALTKLKNTKYFAVKLFNSDRFSGWSKGLGNLVFFLWNTGFTAAIVMIPLLICCVLRIRFSSNRGLKWWIILLTLLFIWFWIFYSWLFLAIGKQTLFPIYTKPGIVKCSRRMGSTVGVLYPGKHLQGIFNYLLKKVEFMETVGSDNWRKHRIVAYDLMLEDYADKVLNLDTYLLVPNVVQHIGRYSAFKEKNQGKFRSMSTSYTFPKEDEAFSN